MKKKLLLIALPALMVLSGCANVQKDQPKVEEQPTFEFAEDTAAHEDLFGGFKSLNIRKIGVPDKDPGNTNIPRIGVQFSGVYEGDVRNGAGEITGKADCIAVRFVAAIKGDLSTQTVLWTRGVSKEDSSQTKSMSSTGNNSAPLTSTDVYTSLKEGDDTVAVPSGYDNYVVYSMYDIPVAYANYYIAAYVTVTPKAGGDSHKSSAVVTEIDGGHYFAVDMDADLVRNGYFLEIYNTSTSIGRIRHEENEAYTDTNPENETKNSSIFENVSIADNETFGLFRLTATRFQFFGYSTFASSPSAAFIVSSSVNDYNSLRISGAYTFYVNHYNLIYTKPENVDVTFTFTPSSHWKEADAIFYLHCFNESGPEGWYKFAESETPGVYTVNATDWAYTKVNYVRKNPSNDDGSWDGKWNQSGDITITFANTSYTMSADEWW